MIEIIRYVRATKGKAYAEIDIVITARKLTIRRIKEFRKVDGSRWFGMPVFMTEDENGKKFHAYVEFEKEAQAALFGVIEEKLASIAYRDEGETIIEHDRTNRPSPDRVRFNNPPIGSIYPSPDEPWESEQEQATVPF